MLCRIYGSLCQFGCFKITNNLLYKSKGSDMTKYSRTRYRGFVFRVHLHNYTEIHQENKIKKLC